MQVVAPGVGLLSTLSRTFTEDHTWHLVEAPFQARMVDPVRCFYTIFV